jgi:alkylhydroperoxidase family enzyme
MARIPYVDPDAASPEVRDALEAMPPLNVFRMLANADSAYVPLVRYMGTLLTALELDEQLRELAILLTAARTGAEYEWVQHEGISRAIGIPEAQIEALRNGHLDDESLGSADAGVLLRFVSEILDGPRASDETFAALRERFPHRQIVEVLLVVGAYHALARLMTTLDLDLDGPVGGDIINEARERLAD